MEYFLLVYVLYLFKKDILGTYTQQQTQMHHKKPMKQIMARMERMERMERVERMERMERWRGWRGWRGWMNEQER